MAEKKKKKMEFRYYQLPPGSPILALLGEKWVAVIALLIVIEIN